MTEPLFVLGNARSTPFERLRGEVLANVEGVREAYGRNARARWVVVDAAALGLLASAVHADDRWHRLLLLHSATTARRELLHALFRVVVAPDDGVRLLPADELTDVMMDQNAADLLIGGVVDTDDKALVLYRGNLDRLVVPLQWFRSGPKARPDFAAFAVTDHGQTVKLGDYEAATDAILYEFDPEARRRMKVREINQDTSFGGALRRLRLARGLSRSDFEPLNAKTVARIERGEVEEPHGETLGILAKRLKVKPDQIKSY
jgi:hypothetical protein